MNDDNCHFQDLKGVDPTPGHTTHQTLHLVAIAVASLVTTIVGEFSD